MHLSFLVRPVVSMELPAAQIYFVPYNSGPFLRTVAGQLHEPTEAQRISLKLFCSHTTGQPAPRVLIQTLYSSLHLELSFISPPQAGYLLREPSDA